MNDDPERISDDELAALALIVASFLAINAYGLCNTYGQLGFG